jgi:hypothetical protein
VTLLDGYIGSPGVETFCMLMALLMHCLPTPSLLRRHTSRRSVVSFHVSFDFIIITR